MVTGTGVSFSHFSSGQPTPIRSKINPIAFTVEQMCSRDSVDYLFSRVMQGMEAALLDKTRRASRTEAEAKETRAELDGLPESVRASLTQGVPLEPDAEEMYVFVCFHERGTGWSLSSKRPFKAQDA